MAVTEQTVEFLADIRTPLLRQLYAYWDERRRGRPMPARRDLDPVEFRFALGHVLLIDVLYHPLRFRFRLHGSELAFRAGYDMTGRMVEELPRPENRAVLVRRCQELARALCPAQRARGRWSDDALRGGLAAAFRGRRARHHAVGRPCVLRSVVMPENGSGA